MLKSHAWQHVASGSTVKHHRNILLYSSIEIEEYTIEPPNKGRNETRFVVLIREAVHLCTQCTDMQKQAFGTTVSFGWR